MKQSIIYKGIELEVSFDYQPEEPEVRYDSNMEGYPGCPESINLTAIEHNGENFSEFFEDLQDEIIEILFEERNEDGDY